MFDLTITTETLGIATLIFGLRVLNNSISTIRLITLARQQRFITAFLGFFEAMIFAVTVAWVVTDLTNLLNMFSYCFGFSVGGFVGMWLESRLITSYSIVNIFANQKGHDVAAALRNHGFGVTETIGEGLKGEVTMLRSVITRRDLPRVMDIVQGAQPEAFVAVEEARTVSRGYVGGMRRMRPDGQP